MTAHNVNVILLGDDNSRLPVGKIVKTGGEYALHCHTKRKYMLRKGQAWGINRALLRYARRSGVRHVYLWVRDAGAAGTTLHATIEAIERLGTPGFPDAYGGNLNLEERYWKTEPGQSPAGRIHVDAHFCAVVDTVRELEEEGQADQMGLFEEAS